MSIPFEQMMRSAAELDSKTARFMEPAPARNHVEPAPAANYEALIDVLTGLCQIPDGLGETILRLGGATAIRRCGFAARAGVPWRCRRMN